MVAGAPTIPSPLWEQLTGSSPDEVINRPTLGIHQEKGIYSGLEFAVAQQPGRVDLVLSDARRRTTPDEILSAPVLVQIGEPDKAIPQFAEIIKKWLATGPVLSRVAFAPIFFFEAPDKQTAYESLQILLPSIVLDPAGMSDMLWQINRPRPSMAVTGLDINRLTKWHVIQLTSVGVTGNLAQPLALISRSAPIVAGRVELDLSTSAQRQEPLPTDKLLDLYGELEKMTLEILQHGDTP